MQAATLLEENKPHLAPVPALEPALVDRLAAWEDLAELSPFAWRWRLHAGILGQRWPLIERVALSTVWKTVKPGQWQTEPRYLPGWLRPIGYSKERSLAALEALVRRGVIVPMGKPGRSLIPSGKVAFDCRAVVLLTTDCPD